MNCLQSVTSSSGRATQCASGSTADGLDDEDDFVGHCLRPPKFIGAPLILEASSKVDKCLARLQSLQGTVAIPSVHVPSTASASLSPIFSRSRSCLHGSPKVHENDKIRIHDVLRWSDDFSGKYKQERREKYKRRLSHSKTEVFDDKKDPLDPHGEWKHWSSPAGDVHKVISEILMASQIAKQITSMVNAVIVNSDVSSDEAKKCCKATKDTATSPNPMRNPAMQQKIRKGDPLHKFRVSASADGPAKKRTNAGNRKEVLYPKSKQPIPERSRLEDASEVTLSTAKKMQSRRSPRAAVKEKRPQEALWSAKDITNSKATRPQAEVRAAKALQSSKSPPRTLVAKPQLSNRSNQTVKPSFNIKQGSRGPHHTRMEPRVGTSATSNARAEAPTSRIKSTRQPLPGDSFVLSSRTKELAEIKVSSGPRSPSSTATSFEIKMCNSSPLPVEILARTSRLRGPVHLKEVTATSAASPDGKMCNSSPDELFEPALDGFKVLRSSIPESGTCSGASSPQVKTAEKRSHQPVLPKPLMGSLRHKFAMEATEIKGPNKPWSLNRSRSGKAVLFSNPTFAPASPNGARPAAEKQDRPVAATAPKSPRRSTSATRTVMDRIGRALSAGRRSISPDITRRLNSTRQKLAYFSPGKSLPSLISRLPSRGKRKPSPVPRPSIVKSASCARPAPQAGELPLPPGRKSQQHLAAAAQEKERKTGHASGSPPAAFTDSSSYFSLRMLKDLNSNAQQFPFRSYNGSKGTTPDIAPRASFTRNNAKQLKCHTSLEWEKEVGAGGVLLSCRKWVEESAPPAPGGFCRYEKENVEPAPQRILIKDNVVATGWDDELAAPAVLSTSRSRKVPTPGGSRCPTPGELNSSSSGVRRSSSTGRIRTGASFLKRARDWVRAQTPNRIRTHTSNWDQPQRFGLVI